MNDEIKLPPLPEADVIYEDGRNEYGYVDHSHAHSNTAMTEYARAAVIADRAARPVADAGDAVANLVRVASEVAPMLEQDWPMAAKSLKDAAIAAPSARTLDDAEIDAIAEAQEKKYGQLCDAEDLRMLVRSAILAATSTPAEQQITGESK